MDTVPMTALADRVGTQEKALFIDLKADQLALDLMEYKHVTGWVAVEQRTIPTWSKFVTGMIDQMLGGNREPDARLLLEVGMARRGDRSISLPQLADQVITTYPWLAKANLVVVHPSLEKLGDALSSTLQAELLIVEESNKSWAEDLLKPVDALPYSLVAFAVDAKDPFQMELGVKPFPKLVAGTPLTPDQPLSDQITFYTKPGTDFVIIRIAGRNPATPGKAEDLGAYKIQNPPRELTVTCTVHYPSPMPGIKAGNAMLELASPDEVRQIGLPQVIQRPPAVDLMLIVDGTMLPPDYQAAVDFAAQLVGSFTNMDSRIGAVVYGEHEHPRGFWEKPPFLTLQTPFGAPQDAVRFLSQVKPFDMEHDFADALEIALSDASKAAWSDRARCLVLIGNSPPHALASEQKKFGTLNVSTEELTGIDWRAAIKKMRGAKVQMAALWVPPTQTQATRVDIKYAQALWKVIGEFFYAPNLDESALEELRSKIMELAGAQKMLEGPIRWPLLAPWPSGAGAA